MNLVTMATHPDSFATTTERDLSEELGTVHYTIPTTPWGQVIEDLVLVTARSTRDLLLHPDFPRHRPSTVLQTITVPFKKLANYFPTFDNENFFESNGLEDWGEKNLRRGFVSLLPAEAAAHIRLAWKCQPVGRVWLAHESFKIGNEEPLFRLDSHRSGQRTLGTAGGKKGSRIANNNIDSIIFLYTPHK
jgi:hypothetical protein